MFSAQSPLPIIVFFLLHWWGSVFMQTFFLHRYASHGVFKLSQGWERFFYLMTYLLQGSSFLAPRPYAYLHRAHHAYSDTDKDPHTPHRFTNAFAMMWETKETYAALSAGALPERRFQGYAPHWPALDRFADSAVSRIGWGVLYTLFYFAFAPSPWWLLLLPFHYLMGPVHGAIVNWAGHKYGYRNFSTRDFSRNVLPWDFVTLGEMFQNNHHRHGQAPKFAQRWFELDPTYPIIKLMHALGILELGKQSLQVEDGSIAPDPAE